MSRISWLKAIRTGELGNIKLSIWDVFTMWHAARRARNEEQEILPGGVMVTLLILVQPFMVRVHAG